MTEGQLRLGHGNVYTALDALTRAGLARSWIVLPGGGRGARRRRYYELTARGLQRAHERSARRYRT